MADSKHHKPAARHAEVNLARLHVWQIQAVRDVLFVAAILALIWVGYLLRAVTVLLLIALTLAYLFEPLVAKLTRNPKTRRSFIVGGLLATVGLLLVVAVIITSALVTTQTKGFIRSVREGQFRNA